MNYIKNFFKGILVGVGGIAPGLSGSVMLLMLGIYEKSINAISTLFKDFKKNIAFLFPLVLGFGCGVIAFSKIVDYLLNNFEFQTRYLFLGLVICTVPLFYKSVRKKGFSRKHCFVIAATFIVGIVVFSFNNNLFPQITNPNFFQSALLGIAVAGSSIIPGVDSAVILSALGLYKLYVCSIANFDVSVLIPAGIGLIIGAILISKIMSFLISRFYTITFSVIFGLFISIIPKVLNSSCQIKSFNQAFLASVLTLFGFLLSLFFCDIKNSTEKILSLFRRKEKL